MKKKIVLITIIIISITFCFGITYSFFHSNSTMNSTDQDIAKFVFKSEKSDQIQLPLIDLKPGDNKEYTFFVSNNYLGNVSNVSIEYQMTIKTYHLIPLDIKLYKLNGAEEELVMTCDETYTRNSKNELVCNSPKKLIGYSSLENDNYKLKVIFPSEYNTLEYSNLVDYINLEINSWQKTEE